MCAGEGPWRAEGGAQTHPQGEPWTRSPSRTCRVNGEKVISVLWLAEG